MAFTVGDADDHPSVPHAHSREKGYRLDAWKGRIFVAGNDRNNQVGQLSQKELSRLHKNQKFIDYVVKQINWYKKEFPDINFYIPEWFNNYLLNKHAICSNRTETPDVYVFWGKAIISYDPKL